MNLALFRGKESDTKTLTLKKFSYDNKDIEGEKDYDTELIDEDQDENMIWKNLSKDKNFNSIFNEMFEKNC